MYVNVWGLMCILGQMLLVVRHSSSKSRSARFDSFHVCYLLQNSRTPRQCECSLSLQSLLLYFYCNSFALTFAFARCYNGCCTWCSKLSTFYQRESFLAQPTSKIVLPSLIGCFMVPIIENIHSCPHLLPSIDSALRLQPHIKLNVKFGC